MILKTVEQVRRIFRIVSGFTLLAAGVVMLVTPGPGWVVILLGLGLLAAEFVWARRLMDRIKREGNRIKDTVLGKPEPPTPDEPPRPPAQGAPDEQMPP
jgi:tellurite resistance protein TerC